MSGKGERDIPFATDFFLNILDRSFVVCYNDIMSGKSKTSVFHAVLQYFLGLKKFISEVYVYDKRHAKKRTKTNCKP